MGLLDILRGLNNKGVVANKHVLPQHRILLVMTPMRELTKEFLK